MSQQKQESTQESKKPYVEPKVATHGTVQETTQSVVHDGRCSGFPPCVVGNL